LVERNLAKVEVESSRLFSRSRIQKREAHKASFFYSKLPLRLSGRNLCAQHGFEFAVTIRSRGGVAKWLCSGLQSRLRRFDPDPRLHIPEKRCGAFFLWSCFTIALCPSGEIGRHSGLKIRRYPEKGRTGSIPVSGTNIFSQCMPRMRALFQRVSYLAKIRNVSRNRIRR
jgi:hypothetical protein